MSAHIDLLKVHDFIEAHGPDRLLTDGWMALVLRAEQVCDAEQRIETLNRSWILSEASADRAVAIVRELAIRGLACPIAVYPVLKRVLQFRQSRAS